MIVRVDPATARIQLLEPEVLSRFHVEAEGDGARVAAAMGHFGRAAPEADHVFVRIDGLRALADGHVSEDWPARFEEMLAFARSRGWVDESGAFLKAHVETPSED